MDRDTIKTLLMTTSVVAIIAGSAQEANATVICASTAVFTTPQSSVTQTTNVACILIDTTTVTGDVTVNPGVTVGPNGVPAEITILDSSVGGGFFNKGTVVGAVGAGISSSFINTSPLTVAATAIAGGATATTASARARARGVLISAGSLTTDLVNGGASALSTSLAAVFRGNVSNSGLINAQSTAFATAGGAGT